MGYVISHPAVFGQPPKLNRLLGAIPAQADCYYIHDLALAPAARGSGDTRDIVPRIGTVAARLGYARIGLVAVNESTPFWASPGFAPERSPDIVARRPSSGARSACCSAPKSGERRGRQARVSTSRFGWQVNPTNKKKKQQH